MISNVGFDTESGFEHRLHDRILRRIAYRIMRSEGREGGHLIMTEAGLSAQLGVSRTVVREAIKVLAAKNLIEVKPKTGIRVRPRRFWNLTDPQLLGWLCEMRPDGQLLQTLCEVREILEPAAAELAARRATPDEILAIQDCFARMERAKQRVRAFITADFQFHGAIFTACHNDLLAQMSSVIRRAFRASLAVTVKVPGGLDPAIRMHHAVAEAIVQQNPSMARAAMLALLAKTTRDVADLLHLNESQPKP